MSNHHDGKINNRSSMSFEENLTYEDYIAVTLYDDQSNAFPSTISEGNQNVHVQLDATESQVTSSVIADQTIDQQANDSIPTPIPYSEE